jgi:hypothetical protein
MSQDQMTTTPRGPLWSTGVSPDAELDTAPAATSLPVRWTTGDAMATQGDGRGADDVTGAGADPGHGAVPGEPEPDAVAKGWVVPPGGSRVDAIFVLAGTSLGIGRVERANAPVWLDLDDLVNLDALGDPVDGLTEVEILMDDHRVIGAGWPEHFCAAVVDVLRATAGRPGATPGSPAAAAAPPASAPIESDPTPDSSSSDAAAGSVGTAVPDVAAPVVAAPIIADREPAPAPAGGPVPVESAASGSAVAPSDGAVPSAVPSPAGALELEDVVYLGGYPGHHKRRKKCVVGMSRTSLDLKGPGDLAFRVGWDVVRTIEVQNSDEARFRMNTKIHRDASALVVECEQGVTLLLEARDCPTIALRSAIAQLLDGQPVVVV